MLTTCQGVPVMKRKRHLATLEWQKPGAKGVQSRHMIHLTVQRGLPGGGRIQAKTCRTRKNKASKEAWRREVCKESHAKAQK